MSRKSYFEGFAAGIGAFRLVGEHAVPSGHPHGSTSEGADWFLGCARALEQCETTFQGECPTESKTTERKRPVPLA